MATYFDPDRQSNVDYTNVKKVLDDVLPGYAQSGGTFTRPIRKYGKHVFSHNTMFCCVKQPPGGQKGAYYAIHHMRAIVRDHHQLLLPSKLKDWAASVSAIQDADLRQEFFRIQSEFAEIIHQDVLRTSGQFYLRNQPSNSDIETMLQMQDDSPFFHDSHDRRRLHPRSGPLSRVESSDAVSSSETSIGSCCS